MNTASPAMICNCSTQTWVAAPGHVIAEADAPG
jgi:hypothetical protein